MNSYIPTYLRDKNREHVLRMFLQNNELSRAEIARQTNISFPTVMKIVDFFIERGVVQETDLSQAAQSGLGRKGKVLQLVASSYGTVGIFFEGDDLMIGLVDLAGNVVERKSSQHWGEVTNAADCSRISRTMMNTVQRFTKAHPEMNILGIGVGFPGIIDPQSGNIERSKESFPTANFLDLFDAFRTDSVLPVFPENDMNAAALGELMLRGDENLSDLIYFSLGTGFGAGIMLNRSIWHGNGNFAGDIGYMIQGYNMSRLDAPTDLTEYRLESRLSVAGIREVFGIDIQSDTPYNESQRQSLIDYLCYYLVPLFYNLSFFMNIHDFILSGIITDFLGDTLTDRISDGIAKLQACDSFHPALRVRRSISQDAGIIGTASLAMQACLPEILS